MHEKEIVRNIAVKCGFSLKPQPDGSEDLHEYVYKFAQDMMALGAGVTAKNLADALNEDVSLLLKDRPNIVEFIDEVM